MAVNKLILKQLEDVHVAKIGEYDELHHTFHIKKFQEQVFEQNKLYVLKLHKSLLNSTDNALLVSNWNNGAYPKHEYVKCVVTKKIAKMIYVYGVYYDNEQQLDLEEEWIGWLPTEQIEVIKEIDV